MAFVGKPKTIAEKMKELGFEPVFRDHCNRQSHWKIDDDRLCHLLIGEAFEHLVYWSNQAKAAQKKAPVALSDDSDVMDAEYKERG